MLGRPVNAASSETTDTAAAEILLVLLIVVTFFELRACPDLPWRVLMQSLMIDHIAEPIRNAARYSEARDEM